MKCCKRAHVLYFVDVTAVCILESFENQQSLLMADRVLKELGKSKAKEAYKVREICLLFMVKMKHVRCYVFSFKNRQEMNNHNIGRNTRILAFCSVGNVK